MTGRPGLLAAAVLLLSGCDSYPRDINGTRDRVEAGRVIRVGLFQESLAGPNRGLAAAYLARLSRATGARPQIQTGAAEPLLARLEAGELDLAIGEIAGDSPWIDGVAVIEPLAEHRLGDRTIGLSPIARNGENRWVMLLEREARDMRSGG